MRAVGLSPHAARFAGIRVERTLLVVALVSGAIAGIAGVSEVAGIQYRLTAGLSPGFGYTGIVVAMLGGLTMPGVLLAGLLLGDLTVGASTAERALGIPSQMGAVVQGTLLLSVVAAPGGAALAASGARSRLQPMRSATSTDDVRATGDAPAEVAGMTFLIDLIAATFRNATPLVYGTVGETITERAGRPQPGHRGHDVRGRVRRLRGGVPHGRPAHRLARGHRGRPRSRVPSWAC